jgi:O-methyltransferase involved in polyketide biosynthesis
MSDPSDIRTKLTVKLTGIPETALWPLHNRAAEARKPDGLLHDPMAVKIADAIDYPFELNFGRPDESHALRSVRFDEEVRRFAQQHPRGTVIALGDGLETQFQRVDDGSITWLSVDLPEVIDIRSRFMIESDRQKHFAGSVLDFRWMDQVNDSRGVFITAQGLLMYLQAAEVAKLISACAERFPGAEMMFDAIPRWFSALTLRGLQKTKAYRLPPMPWALDVNELDTILSFSPNIVALREIDIGRGRSFLFGYAFHIIKKLPVIGKKRPSLVMIRFGYKSRDE